MMKPTKKAYLYGPTRRDDLRELARQAAQEVSLGPLSTLTVAEFRVFASDMTAFLEDRIALLH
jgi:hypothetical protein